MNLERKKILDDVVTADWRGRRNSNYSMDYDVKIPLKNLNKGTGEPIKIYISLFKELKYVHKLFFTYWGKHKVYSTHYETMPAQFLLGEKDNIIMYAEPVMKYSCYGDNCGNMHKIDGNYMAELMMNIISKGYNPCGIARIGVFYHYDNGRGRGLYDIYQICKGNPNFFVLSLGKEDLVIDYIDKEGYTKQHNYIVGSLKTLRNWKSNKKIETEEKKEDILKSPKLGNSTLIYRPSITYT